MTVPKPPIIERFVSPVNHYNVTRDSGGVLCVPEAVVVHTTAGSRRVEDLFAWFSRPDVQACTTFGIDQMDGRIMQYAPLSAAPYAHGLLNNPTAELVTENAGLNPNAWAIGIELLDGGVPGDHTAVQLDSLVQLVAWLFDAVILPNAARTGAAIDRKHILGHYQFDGVTRARCPSWPAVRWQWLIDEVRDLVYGVVPPAPPVPPVPDPEPPAVDWQARYMVVINEVLAWQRDDEIGAQLRRARLYDLAAEK